MSHIRSRSRSPGDHSVKKRQSSSSDAHPKLQSSKSDTFPKLQPLNDETQLAKSIHVDVTGSPTRDNADLASDHSDQVKQEGRLKNPRQPDENILAKGDSLSAVLKASEAPVDSTYNGSRRSLGSVSPSSEGRDILSLLNGQAKLSNSNKTSPVQPENKLQYKSGNGAGPVQPETKLQSKVENGVGPVHPETKLQSKSGNVFGPDSKIEGIAPGDAENSPRAIHNSNKGKKRKSSSPPATLPARKSSRLSEKKIDYSETHLSPSADFDEPQAIKKSRSKTTESISESDLKLFEEPELAVPKPIYTGLPLESFPTAKIKKDALWPSSNTSNGNGSNGNSKKSSKSSSNVNSRHPSLSPGDNLEELERDYRLRLKTTESNHLTTPSEVRDPITSSRKSKSAPKKTSTGLKLVIKTPKKDRPASATLSTSNSVNLTSSAPSLKKVKVISPKKNPSTNLAPVSSSHHDESSVPTDDPTKDNEDFCATCGGSGVFICCDSCPKSFHFSCCDPPLKDCPEEDDWNCRSCTAKQNPSLKKTWNHIGLFGQLLNQHEGRNPVEFHLPKKLRENIVAGVTTDALGNYKDDSIKPELSYSKVNGSQLAGFNRDDDLEIDTLYDTKGNPYLCHKCGKSGLKKRTIIHCDYCPLVWHLDCLDYVLCSTKTLGSKWKCPNHVDHLLPSNLYQKRNFKDSSVIEVSLHNHFLQVASLNNFFIKHDDQPFLKDGAATTFNEYIQFEQEDFLRSYSQRDPTITKESSEKEQGENVTHPMFKLPSFFEVSSFSDSKVMATAGPKLVKTLALTDRYPDHSVNGSFLYRVPEKSILLSFLAKGHQPEQAKNQYSPGSVTVQKKKVMEELSDYDNRSRLETNRDELELVDGLAKFKSHPVEHHQKSDSANSIDFEEFVQLALSLDKPKSEQNGNSLVEEEISADEAKDLLNIKKLIQLKGRDSLIQFLKS